MKVNYDEVMRILAYKKSVNDVPLEEIEWVRDDGSVIEVDKEIVNFYKFTGLSNFYFARDMVERLVNGEKESLLEEIKEWK